MSLPTRTYLRTSATNYPSGSAGVAFQINLASYRDQYNLIGVKDVAFVYTGSGSCILFGGGITLTTAVGGISSLSLTGYDGSVREDNINVQMIGSGNLLVFITLETVNP